MIPVTPQAEPAEFNERVRKRGADLIDRRPDLEGKKFRKKACKIWTWALPELYQRYSKICAYSAEWMPHNSRSIDHFVSIFADKSLAFEWNNYRLAFPMLNESKGQQVVLDPFLVGHGWFQIDYPSLLMRSNPTLEKDLQDRIEDTITKLKLNEFALHHRRIKFLRRYRDGESLTSLDKFAPFFVLELRRHGLADMFKKPE